MEIWIPIATWIVAHIQYFGLPVFVAGWLTILLPLLIAQTPHARAQTPPVPRFPTWPSAHIRLWGYAFSRAAFDAGNGYSRTLLWLFRAAWLVGGAGVILLFAAFVSLDPGVTAAQ